MARILSELLLCCSTACLLGVPAQLSGEEPSDDNLKKLADDSRSRAEAIEVSVAIGDRTTKAKVCPDPIMKYTDPPRQIEMATLWVWQVEGCPVALGKVEAYRRPGGPSWLYCFASTSTGLVEGQWPDGHRFPASHAGIEWKAIDGPAPLETAAGRQRQMKELFRRFSATVFDDHAKTSDALRPLARPLHEYSSPRQGILQGIFCGLTANGTNPDAIVALEAVGPEKGKEGPKSWRYGVVPMTATGVIVKLDKAEVFTRQPEWRPGDHEKWTYFWEGTPKK